jgi:Tol biopolymer transport system component
VFAYVRVWLPPGALAALLLCAGSASGGFPGRPGQIAFTSDRSGFEEVVTMDVAGKDRSVIVSAPASDPAWSPDGTRIAYVRDARSPAVFVANADGSRERRVAEGATPEWSPDGSRLVVSRRSAGGADLWVIDVASGEERRLIRTEKPESEPAWSPDGRAIAFVRTEARGGDEIYAVRPNGRGLKRLTRSPHNDGGPAWSPDATQIAFVRHDDGRAEAALYVMAADGTGQRPLGKALTLDPVADFAAGPAWSPDGRRIVLARGARLYSDLYVFAADGRFARRMTENAKDQVTERSPSWQPVCTIRGTEEDDVLTGTRKADVVCGLGGDDTIRTLAGGDVVIGGEGDDRIDGGAGRDRLFGSAGSDTLLARDRFRDVVDGGPGGDAGQMDPRRDLRQSIESRG